MLKFLFIAYLAGQVLDTSTSVYAFRHGFSEMNAALAWAPARPALFIGYKTGLSGAGAWAAYTIHKRKPKVGKVILAGMAGAAWYAGLHNLRELRKTR